MSALFNKIVATLQDSKNLDTILAGSSFLDEGTYQFTIMAVDHSLAKSDNKVIFTFQTDDGQNMTDSLFVLSKDKNGVGEGFRRIFAGCIQDGAAVADWLTAVDADHKAFGMLTGMKLQATLKRSPGFRVHSLAAGGYAAFAGPDNTSKQLTEPCDDVAGAREAAKAAGHKQSYVKITSTKATHAEANLKALRAALAGKAPAAAARKAI